MENPRLEEIAQNFNALPKLKIDPVLEAKQKFYTYKLTTYLDRLPSTEKIVKLKPCYFASNKSGIAYSTDGKSVTYLRGKYELTKLVHIASNIKGNRK